jgi:hypothetical protein
LAPPDAIDQLRQLDRLAAQNLLPQLVPPFHLAPEFDGSCWCAADADLIAGGLLLDIKVVIPPRLEREQLDQLLGYTLFDFSDKYQITDIGIYSARYGWLVTWSLDQILEPLAGEPVDLAELRGQVKQLLAG